MIPSKLIDIGLYPGRIAFELFGGARKYRLAAPDKIRLIVLLLLIGNP